eukprot:5721656-Ditylum_brightwellii.AAC.1
MSHKDGWVVAIYCLVGDVEEPFLLNIASLVDNFERQWKAIHTLPLWEMQLWSDIPNVFVGGASACGTFEDGGGDEE